MPQDVGSCWVCFVILDVVGYVFFLFGLTQYSLVQDHLDLLEWNNSEIGAVTRQREIRRHLLAQ